MNKHVQEIISDSWTEVMETSVDPHINRELVDVFERVFAEKLINECLNQVTNEMWKTQEGASLQKFVVSAVKRHFNLDFP